MTGGTDGVGKESTYVTKAYVLLMKTGKVISLHLTKVWCNSDVFVFYIEP